MRAGDQLEVAVHLFIRAKRKKGFFFDGLQQHGLLIQPQLGDFIEKQHAAVGFA